VALLNESQEPNEDSRHAGNFTISPWVLSALNHVSSTSQPPEARDKSVSQMREEIAGAQSEIAVCNALFELGCLLSVARSLYADVGRGFIYLYVHPSSCTNCRVFGIFLMRISLFPLCSSHSFSPESIEGIVVEVSCHLDESRLPGTAAGSNGTSSRVAAGR
jgi:hypothetical protein